MIKGIRRAKAPPASGSVNPLIFWPIARGKFLAQGTLKKPLPCPRQTAGLLAPDGYPRTPPHSRPF